MARVCRECNELVANDRLTACPKCLCSLRPPPVSWARIAIGLGGLTAIMVGIFAVAGNVSVPLASTASPDHLAPDAPSSGNAPAAPIVAAPVASQPEHPVKLTARERKKQREQESALAEESFCGKPPDKLGDTYMGAENVVEQAANDPGSVDFVACMDAIKEPMPACWTTYCKFRAKNGFGALVLEMRRFSYSSARGWRLRDQ